MSQDKESWKNELQTSEKYFFIFSILNYQENTNQNLKIHPTLKINNMRPKNQMTTNDCTYIEQVEQVFIGGRVQVGASTMEILVEVSPKAKIELPYDPALSFLITALFTIAKKCKPTYP